MGKQQSQLAYGIHAVTALIARRANAVLELLVADSRDDKRIQEVLALAQEKGVSIRRLKKTELDELASGTHQGVAVYFSPQGPRGEGELTGFLESLPGPALLLILDGITDPHNFGACLRSADAAGVDAVIYPKDKSAELNATVRKVASGAADIMPLFQVTNLARNMRNLQEAGIWTVGLAGEAEQGLYEVDMRGPTAIVMGAEGAGLRKLTREHCDYLANIPLAGSVSSLNVSVATGVALFEAVRQRR